MSKRVFDAIVIGVGGMGSATVYELARRGVRTLGLEQFQLVHDRGSSHGQTRVIRTAYYEHADYVPLVRRAFERWYDLEQVAGARLLTNCPCLNVGLPTSSVVQGVRQSAHEHDLPIEEMTGAEIRRRFRPLQFSDEYIGILEHQAGFLFVEECVRAHIDASHSLGAEIHAEEFVRSWNSAHGSVEVETDRGRYSAKNLIITAGPWAGRMLAERGKSLSVMRQTMLWFGTRDDALFRRDCFPVYLAEVPEGCFYGLPVIDGSGHKVARHYGAPELDSPDDLQREVSDDDLAPVRKFLDRYVPQVQGPWRRSQVCTYTLTPDRHFIVDRHPDYDNVAIAAGFSGHGFKFAPVIGEIMADLALEGRTKRPIEMFRIDRF